MNFRLHCVLCISVLLAAGLSSTAEAQLGGTLTNGNATYTQTLGPLTVGSAGPAADFRPEGGATVDHLDQNWWWYRVAGDTRERPFGTWTDGPLTMTGSSLYAGNVSTLNFTETLEVSPILTVTRFSATYTATLVDGASPGSARLQQSFQINNPTATPLTISLFNYVDFDLNGQVNDSSTAGGGLGLIQNIHGTTVGFMQGDNPSRFQASSFSTILSNLQNGAVDDLTNSGLPFGSGDFTGAFQWDLTIPANSSLAVTGYLEIVPEPGSLALVGVLVVGTGLFLRRRGRRPLVKTEGIST